MIRIVEEQKQKPVDKRFEELKGKVQKKEGTSKEEFIKQLATREKLERDFKEDKVYVTFNSSPETRRTILARKPNQKEFLQVLKLSLEAARFQGLGDPDSLEKLANVYSGLNKIAASLSIDKKLDEKFWEEHVSFSTLQEFINELIAASQEAPGGMTEADMKSFRGE